MIPPQAIGAVAEAAGSAVQGLTSIASGIIGSGARRREQRQAQAEYDRNMQQFQQQDTSNLYANMENPFADLTVNQQAANFARQQQQQASANLMQNLQGAAGGSGIAALAQSLAQQEASSAQAAAADIGRQEAANQARTAGAAMDLQRLERMGAETARGLELDKRTTLLGMSQERLAAADQARKDATGAIVGGIGQFAGGAAAAGAAASAEYDEKGNLTGFGSIGGGLKSLLGKGQTTTT
tara:strand:- start:700 stop:1419 length:720 start_codon:yes stop_codon:yes gene_type:complete